MKKLRIKVFFTIFIILTTFSFSLLLLSNIREYSNTKNEIERVFERNERGIGEGNFAFFRPSREFLDRNDIFIDFKVYTFSLNQDGSYNGLVKAFFEQEDDTESVINYAKKITKKKNKDNKDINLIFNKYSYKINGSVLMVVDNSYQSNKVVKYLVTSICIFAIVEVISVIIARFLTKWIVKPVEESFEREKRFIGDASHELKTPIAVIMASTDLYEQDKDKKWINNIKSESDRMNKLVTELLDLNNLENNNKDFKKENINLSKLIESSLLPYESLFFENKLKFDYDIKEDIYFDANEAKIKELISILIDNAIKYSREHGHVKVSFYKDKDIYLKVSNKGEEIPLEDREKIFNRFYKVDKSRNRESNNYGLGLSIAKKIVELHDGKISVDCSHGTTTFTVKF